MNLYNLKTTVPAKLYKRGQDYFEQDFVEQLTEDAPIVPETIQFLARLFLISPPKSN